MTPPNKTRVTAFIILYYGGIAVQLVLFFTTFIWILATNDLRRDLIGLIIMIIQAGIMLSSGLWWLPICIKLTKLQPQEQHGRHNMD